ncbi:MAG: hypothetical protein JNL22_04450 [Bacteroidales bacterium]|nr:hypothetical protein [Bacteroidales bacterium]
MTPKPQATKIALNQINKLVIFGDFVCWCQKKERKVPVLNNGCNPVLSMSSKGNNYFPRTTMKKNKKKAGQYPALKLHNPDRGRNYLGE